MTTRTSIAAALVLAATTTFAPAPAAAQHVVTHAFQLPPFSTTDNFFFETQENLAVPYFNAAGDRLYLMEAKFHFQYSSSAIYTMTNVGTIADFAKLKSQPYLEAPSPGGPLVGPNFGSPIGGPFLNPGQSGTAITGGYNHTRTKGGGSAQPYVGEGDYIVPIYASQTHSVVDPQNFTAVYAGGTVNPLSLTVTYTYRCIGDADSDGLVNVVDLLAVINAWGQIGWCDQIFEPCNQDVSPPWGDGMVNVADLLAVINNWGTCPTP